MVNEEFLEKRIDDAVRLWKQNKRLRSNITRHEAICHIQTPTQIYETESGKLRFILWNMLGAFNGHYEVVANPDTFDYDIAKYADYVSLISYKEIEGRIAVRRSDLSEEKRTEMDASVALTILRSVIMDKHHRWINVIDKHIQNIVFGKIESDDLTK